MPDKRQKPGADESPRVAIRRHTDRCFHTVEEVVYDGPPTESTAPQAEGSAEVLGYIIDGVMIDADDVAEVRHVPDGGGCQACQ